MSLLAVGSSQLDPRLLKPHPRNAIIYGEEEDVTELVESIRTSGWVKSLVVTPTRFIISGHRRLKAALTLSLKVVPVEVREFDSQVQELEALLLENCSRHKTTEQKVREAAAWKEIESKLALQRKSEAGKSAAPGLPKPKECENFRTLPKGRTVDRLAYRVGLGSGRNYEKASKVVVQIDEEERLGNRAIAKILRFVLNTESVDAAHRLVKTTNPERQQIIELIAAGKARTTKQAQQQLKQSGYRPLPNGCVLDGFSVGDWVEVNSVHHPHHGKRGQVDLLLPKEQQVSVILEDVAHCVRFELHELTLMAKAPPPCPYQAGDLVRIDIDRTTAIDTFTRKYKGLWGIVLEIGELGSVKVDVGSISLPLLPFDLKPIDNPSPKLQEVARRVLRLRKLELDEAVEVLLDFLQAREWFTFEQLVLLESIEKLYYLSPRAVNSLLD